MALPALESRMSDDSRLTALTTACDDLQAQLEAGDRTVRHVDEDLTDLGATLTSLTRHTAMLAQVLQHMRELRANMREQRKALREVRAAATALCASVTSTQEKMLQLGEDASARDRRRDTVDVALSPFGSAAPHGSRSEIDE